MTKPSRKQRRLKNTEPEEQIDTKRPGLGLTLPPLKALTRTQHDVIDSYSKNKHQFLYGCAGTGKTYLALALALGQVIEGKDPFQKVIVVRSAVPTRDIGFLPGKTKDKMAEYEIPYVQNINKLFGRGDAYQICTTKRYFEFMSTSFVRGLTVENAIVIIDETQNMTGPELHSVVTRIGTSCRVIMCGDISQADINKRKESSGLRDFMEIAKSMNSFDFIEFGIKDVVRSGFVKEYLMARYHLESHGVIQSLDS